MILSLENNWTKSGMILIGLLKMHGVTDKRSHCIIDIIIL